MANPTGTEEKARRRRRRLALGEAIGIAALVISGLGLWNSWRNSDDKPAVVLDRAPKPIPLVLRGTIDEDGKVARLAPLEASHALDTLTLTAAAPGKGTASFGSEPMLSASMIETWLPANTEREGSGTLPVTAAIAYVEAGETRTANQRYRVAFVWKDGGLLSGKSIRLTAFTRG